VKRSLIYSAFALITAALVSASEAHGQITFIPNGEVTQREAAAIRTVFGEVYSMLKTRMKMPRAEVHMFSQVPQPNYSPGQIVIGYEWVGLARGRRAVCRPLNASWIHEFGLSIFDANMRERLPLWNASYGQIAEKALDRSSGTSVENMQALLNNPTFQKLNAFQKPYSELFADFLAVVYSNDPAINYKCYTSVGKSKPEDNISVVSTPITARSMLDFIDPQLNSDLYFAAAKSLLWRQYSSPACRRDRGLFMRGVFEALSQEIQERWNGGQTANLNIRVANERLIEKFQSKVRCQ
jgi:hypothetical protein